MMECLNTAEAVDNVIIKKKAKTQKNGVSIPPKQSTM